MEKILTLTSQKVSTLIIEALVWWFSLVICVGLLQIPQLSTLARFVLVLTTAIVGTYITLITPQKIDEFWHT